MYSNTPTSKFLVLAPIQSGPDAAIAPDSPQLDTPATPTPSASYASSTTSTTSSSSSSSYDESGFLYLGYHQPVTRRTTLSDSDSESIPEPGSIAASTISPSNSALQCLPLTGKEWKPVVTSSLPSGTVPERFTTTPLFLNF